MKKNTSPFSFSLSLILLGIAFFLPGCKPVPVVDLPASELDVVVSVIDIEEAPGDGKVPVIVQFFNAGKFVRLANAEVACNGVALIDSGLGPAGRVPMQAAGGSYACIHARNGVLSSVSVAVPPRPVFSPPTIAGASIPRSNSLIIRYVSDAGSGIRGRASDSAGHSLDNVQADDGSHEGMDVGGFVAGAGALGLAREIEDAAQSSGFNSAKRKFTTGKAISISWQ